MRGMAWRIEESLIRGEVDNRVRGQVTGRLWFVGREEPVVLELEGNAWRDVAGHVLRFTNPTPKAGKPGELDGLRSLQRGVVGDITASRKVKVPECSMDELMEFYKARKPFPWHWGNSLYLEWHGEFNGRVVIEAAHYTLDLDPEMAWTMTEEEEAAQREANGRAMTEFMERLAKGIDAQAAEDMAWNEETEKLFAEDAEEDEESDGAEGPGVEARYIDFGDEEVEGVTTREEARADEEAARMDLLLDRIHGRMEREGLGPEELDRVMEEERARLRKERGEPEPEPLTPEEEAERDAWIEEMNAIADEALADRQAGASRRPDADGEAAALEEGTGDDWDEEDHPLVEQCRDLSLRLREDLEEMGWLKDEDPREHSLREFADGVMIASGKLAGALSAREEWPPAALFAGGVLVRLKKARRHLVDAIAGAHDAGRLGLVDAKWLLFARLEVEGVLEETETLIREVREVLEREEGLRGPEGDGEGEMPF